MTFCGELKQETRDRISAAQTPVTLRQDLIGALRVARYMVQHHDGEPNHRGNRQIVECKNQLTLLDCIYYGLIEVV